MRMHWSLLLIALWISESAICGEFYVGTSVGMSSIDDSADASRNNAIFLNQLPDDLSVGGRVFDSDETAWGATAGWKAFDWLAIEISYTDLGTASEDLTALFGLVTATPILAPPRPFLPPDGGFAINAAPPPLAALDIEEWSVAAKFRKQLISRLAATWTLGVTRSEFDAQGSVTVPEVLSVNPPVVNLVSIPFASPDNETGFTWGLGFEWQFSERFAIDLGFRRHDTQVLEVDSIALRVLATL